MYTSRRDARLVASKSMWKLRYTLQICQTLPQRVYDSILGIQAEVLNDFPSQAEQADDALDARLKTNSAQLKAEAIDPDGRRVNYDRLKDSSAYRDYRQLAARLPYFDLDTLATDEQQLAFWLNLYNSLVIDGIVHYGLSRSVNQIYGFFRRTAYAIGGYRFRLDDIEHGILRANAGHPFLPGPQFDTHDPRRQFMLASTDPRIHFALVCGARSCPPINFYDADKVDVQLDLATRNYLSQNVEINLQQRVVTLSKLMQWYAEDFGAGSWLKFGLGERTPLLHFIKTHMADDNKRAILDDPDITLSIHFKRYDWALNAL